MNTSLTPNVNLNLVSVCREFLRFGYNLLGAYLDALAGLEVVRQEIIRRQNENIDKLRQTQPQNATVEFMDQQAIEHWLEANQQQPEELLHRSTQGELKRRTASGGLDAYFLGYMMVALLYGAWEDKYREKIALSLGHSEKNGLKLDIFQDINKLRQAILHNHAKATLEVEQAKIIKWFKQDEEIFISRDQARQLLDEIDHYLTQLCGIETRQEFEIILKSLDHRKT